MQKAEAASLCNLLEICTERMLPIISLKHFSCQARCMVLAEEWSYPGDRLVDHHTLSGGLPKQQLITERRWLHEIS